VKLFPLYYNTLIKSLITFNVNILKLLFYIKYLMIKIDYREKKLIPIIQSLNVDYNFNIPIEVHNLPIGDIIICDEKGN